MREKIQSTNETERSRNGAGGQSLGKKAIIIVLTKIGDNAFRCEVESELLIAEQVLVNADYPRERAQYFCP